MQSATADSADITVINTSSPEDGSFDLLIDLSYTPVTNFSGSDTLRLSVYDRQGFQSLLNIRLDVAPVNDPIQVSTGGNELVVLEDSLATFTIFFSDTDGISADFSSSSDSQANISIVSQNTFDLTFTYEAPEDYFGDDSLFFTVTDDAGFPEILAIGLHVEEQNDPMNLTFGSTTHNTQGQHIFFFEQDTIIHNALDLFENDMLSMTIELTDQDSLSSESSLLAQSSQGGNTEVTITNNNGTVLQATQRSPQL